MNVSAYHPNRRPTRKTRLAASLFAACAAFILASSAAHCEPTQPASSKDGEYFDANGNPTYHIENGKVDWYTYSGYLRYAANCLRCHGPDGLGSSYAPNLVNSLKTMNYDTFTATVAGGRKTLGAGQELVMPALGADSNVMCYIDDIYVYLKARASGALGRNRPTEHEPKPKKWAQAQDACMGSE